MAGDAAGAEVVVEPDDGDDDEDEDSDDVVEVVDVVDVDDESLLVEVSDFSPRDEPDSSDDGVVLEVFPRLSFL